MSSDRTAAAPTPRAELEFRPLPQMDEPWTISPPGARLEAIERAAPALRDAILESGLVTAVRTLDVARFPYPTAHAFGGACTTSSRYVWLFNRALLIEFSDLAGRNRRLLANPTRPEGSRKAPYFRAIYQRVPGWLEGPFEKIVGRRAPSISDQLRKLGVAPSSIDFITFDHLHVQEVGPLLGPDGEFPNAVLLVSRAEERATRSLHPLQRYWYVQGALNGVRGQDIHLFDRDLLLGSGVALIRTPGHTEGNHTIVFALPDGLMTVSENGVAAECYAPEKSRLPGLAAYARRTGERAILNANTREQTLDQYTSMRLEALLSAPRDPEAFPRHFSSSELVHTVLAPGIRPTFAWTSVAVGEITGC